MKCRCCLKVVRSCVRVDPQYEPEVLPGVLAGDLTSGLSQVFSENYRRYLIYMESERENRFGLSRVHGEFPKELGYRFD